MKLSVGSEYSFSPAAKQAEAELVQCAMEALELKDELMQAKLDMEEINVVCENLGIAVDTISKHGLKAYIYSIDSENTFAKTFGLESYEGGLSNEALEALQEKYIDAGCEGIKEALKSFWEKIKAFVKKVIAWFRYYFFGTSNKWKDENLDTAEKIINSIDYVSGDSRIQSKNIMDERAYIHQAYVDCGKLTDKIGSLVCWYMDEILALGASFTKINSTSVVENAYNRLEQEYKKKFTAEFGITPTGNDRWISLSWDFKSAIEGNPKYMKKASWAVGTPIKEFGFTSKADFQSAIKGLKESESKQAIVKKVLDKIDALQKQVNTIEAAAEREYDSSTARYRDYNRYATIREVARIITKSISLGQKHMESVVRVRKQMGSQLKVLIQCTMSWKRQQEAK